MTVESNELLLENKYYPSDLTCHVRDPKVWAQDGKYYMVLGARTKEDRGELLVYKSEDKRRWQHCNTLTTQEKFGYMWECPDLFCLDGQWFLQCSPQGVKQQGNHFQNVYTCGYFPLDGDFRSEYTLADFQEMDCGFDFYAPQTFVDGERRILIGWMGMPDAPYTNPTAEQGWQHCLTVPCLLRRDGKRLLRTPVPEIDALRGKHVAPEEASVFDMECRTQPQGRLVIRGSAVIEWEEGLLRLKIDGGGAGRTVRCAEVGEVQTLRVLADVSSLEIFVNGGEQVLSTRYYPAPYMHGVTAFGAETEIWEMGTLQITEQQDVK